MILLILPVNNLLLGFYRFHNIFDYDDVPTKVLY